MTIETILHQAVRKADVQSVQILIDKRCIDINAQDEKGNTALKLASQGDVLMGMDNLDKKLEIVKILLKAGANSDIADEDNDTPLGVACSWSSEKIFEEIAFLLLEAKANIHKINNKNQNALHLCAPHSEKLSLELISRGIDINAVDINNVRPITWAILNSNNEKLIAVLLDKMEDISDINRLILEHKKEISDEILIVWYSHNVQNNRYSENDILENIKNKPKEIDTWNKVCGFLDYCLQAKQFDLALKLDTALTKEQMLIGYTHKFYPIYKIMVYMLHAEDNRLEEVLFDSIIYGKAYIYRDLWRESWKYISDKEFSKLGEKTEKLYQKAIAKFPYENCYNYENYTIEARPFIWLEKTVLKRAKEKCVLTGENLVKGSTVYKFKNISTNGYFRFDFFYAGVTAFEANPVAMENKRKFEEDSYVMKDFVFYWQHEILSVLIDFWYNIDTFSLEETLKLLTCPLFSPSSFKHRYGDFIDGGGLVKRQHEYFYNKTSLAESKGKGYLNIWHALIKCGYIDQIIEYLPKLPTYVPYLLLCFDLPEVKEKVEAYVNIKGIASIIDLAFKNYAHKNEKDLKQLIQFSVKHPEVIEDIAKLLNTYELHLYNTYSPSIDWYCQAFAHFRTAHGAGLLDLLIPYPRLLKPLELLLEYGGELIERTYSDSEIFFIRTVILHTSLFNVADIGRLWKSLSNYSDGEVYFEGVEEKVYKKTYTVNQRLMKILNIKSR